jgi:hypothetical protein
MRNASVVACTVSACMNERTSLPVSQVRRFGHQELRPEDPTKDRVLERR